MQIDNEENNISWSSSPKKKNRSTSNKWRVPNFEFDLQSKNSRTLKRKSKQSRRKFDFSYNPNENLNLLPPHNSEVLSPVLNTKIYENPNTESPVLYEKRHHSDSDNESSTSPIINQRNLLPHNEILSPILNTKTHEKPTEESFLNESPVLNEKRYHSDSEVELESSPVINRKSNKLIKLGKIRLKINNACVRQLTQLNNNEIINNISKNIEIKSNDNPCEEKIVIESNESQKQIVQSNTPVNIDTNNYKGNKIFKNFAWKFKQEEEKLEIETFDSQEISNTAVVHTNNETVKSKIFLQKGKIQQIWNIAPTEEKVEIEQINSQEILTPHFNNETNKTKSNESKLWKLQPTEETEIESINSPEILTQKSLNIETSQSSRKTSEDEKCVIDSVESEISSLVTISSTGTVVQDSLEKSSEEYQLSPKKKKKYKPGTLAYQFHKLLRKQKADVAIWKHELYLTSTSTYQIPATKEDHLITNLKICKMFVDFGTNVWECLQCDLNNEKCLVIASINFSNNLSLTNGDSIKIIPPFYIKNVLINNVNVKTFINVHKITKL